jgi:hypothetical protein
MQKQYLLIAGRLYLTTGDCTGTEPGNLYPCSLGELTGNLPVGFGAIMTHHGDTLTLFGRRYEVNCLKTDGTCEDEIDLELVLLCEPGDPEGEATCAACGRWLEDTPTGPRCPDLSYHEHEDWPTYTGFNPDGDYPSARGV